MTYKTHTIRYVTMGITTRHGQRYGDLEQHRLDGRKALGAVERLFAPVKPSTEVHMVLNVS